MTKMTKMTIAIDVTLEAGTHDEVRDKIMEAATEMMRNGDAPADAQISWGIRDRTEDVQMVSLIERLDTFEENIISATVHDGTTDPSEIEMIVKDAQASQDWIVNQSDTLESLVHCARRARGRDQGATLRDRILAHPDFIDASASEITLSS